MPDQDTELSGAEIVNDLMRLGIADLFKDEEFRAVCIAELKETIGTGVPGCGVMAAASYRLIHLVTGSAAGLLTDAARNRALSFLEKAPLIRRFYARLVMLADKCRDRAHLKAELVEALGRVRPDRAPPSPTESVQDLHAVLTRAQLEDLQGTASDILSALRESHEGLTALIRDQYAPVLDDKSATGSAARSQIDQGARMPTLNYTAKFDGFEGREQALNQLWAFALQTGRRPQDNQNRPQDTQNQFGWLPMIADGGEGKSRLALEFMKEMSNCDWRAGFLPFSELQHFTQTNVRRWRPAEPTLFIIDYPAEAPSEVAALVLGLAQAGHESDFDYPVRLLLLERRAAGKWFDGLMPKGSDGPLVAGSRWQEAFHLPPLGREHLVSLMSKRFGPDSAPPPEDLWQALVTVDNRKQEGIAAPRALFAVATALWLSEHQGQPLSREEVLADLLNRERGRVWFSDLSADEAANQLRHAHENLLAVSTMALSPARESFEALLEAGTPSANNLPRFGLGATPPLFEADRFMRMSGSNPDNELGALQPDLLGEYFALSVLKARRLTERENLIEWALQLVPDDDGGPTNSGAGNDGGSDEEPSRQDPVSHKSGMVQFITRTFRDFPEDFDSLGGLLVKGSTASELARALALFEISSNEGRGVEAEHVERLRKQVYELWDALPPDAPELAFPVAAALFNVGVTLGELQRNDEEIATYDDLITRFADTDVPAVQEQIAKALVNKGVTLGQLQRHDEAMATYDDLVTRFADTDVPTAQEQIAKTIVNKGVTLGQLQRHNEAIATYDDLVTRFVDTDVPAVQEQIAKALFNKSVTLGQLQRSDEEIATYDDLVTRFADTDVPAVQEQIAMALVNKGGALGQLQRSDEAMATYDELVTRFADTDVPGVQEAVARARVNKGLTLGQLQRSEEAIAAFDELVTRFADTDVPGVQEQIAKAIVNKGVTLGQLQRRDEAIATYDDLVIRFADADVPGVKEHIAMALVNKGVTLGQLQRSEEAIATYDDLVIRFADADVPGVKEHIAMALVNKGVTLGQLQRSEEAIATYDDLVTRFADTDVPAVQEQIAMALVNKGVTLGQLQRSEEAIATYDDLVIRFADTDVPGVQEQIAMALFNKGMRLGQLQRRDEEIAAFDELVTRFADTDVPGVQEQIAKTLVYKGVRLGQLQRHDEAIATYDELVTRFAGSDVPAIQEQIAKTLVYKGVRLGQLQRHDEAIATYDELVTRFAGSDVPTVQEQIARALVNKGVRLGQLQRHDEAMATYDELVTRFADTDVPTVQEQIARALVNKGVRLGQLQRHDEAMATYDELVTRFADTDVPTVQEQIAKALLYKGVALGQLQRSDEAVAAYNYMLTRFAEAATRPMQILVALARFGLVTTSDMLERYSEAQALLRAFLADYGDGSWPELERQLETARHLLTELDKELNGRDPDTA